MSALMGPEEFHAAMNAEPKVERVELHSPYGFFRPRWPTRIPNGTKGKIVKRLPNGSFVIRWDAYGEFVTPAHWFGKVD